MRNRNATVDYETPADVVEREQSRHRAAMWWMLPAIGIGVLGLGLGFIAAAVASRTVQIIAFGLGCGAVILGIGTVARTTWVVVTGMLRRK